MVAKALLVVASALFVQTAYSACLGAGYAAPFGTGCGGFGGYGLGAGLPFDGLAYGGLGGCGISSTGGGLPCASASPIPPAGVSVLSENVYEGGLAVGGNLPFLGTVGLEGLLPTAGAGAVSYGCGAGCGIAVEEGPIATGIAPSVGYGAGLAGAGFNGLGYGGFGAGLAGTGLGYGGFGADLIGTGLGCGGLGYGYGLGGGFGCGGIY